MNPAREFVFFFLGGDPAPSESKRSDDGALNIGAATPRRLPEKDEPLSDNPADWYFDHVYARRFTYKQKLSSRQWSGLIHQQHRAFGFAKIVLDPGGGGIFVKRDLILQKQVINGVEENVKPIGDLEDGPKLVVNGDFILHLMKRGDPGVDRVFPSLSGEGKSLAGDELLKDQMIATYEDAVAHHAIGWPANIEDWYAERRAEIEAWPEERLWALKNLNANRDQLAGMSVITGEDGIELRTKRGARQFRSLGRDDIAFSGIYAYCAFLIWLKSEDWRSKLSPEDVPAFSGWGG